MHRSISLKSKLIAVVILPLLLVGITSIASLHYLESSNFETILADKHSFYKKTLQSLISAKWDLLTFRSTVLRDNKNLAQFINLETASGSIKQGKSEQISKYSAEVFKNISEDNHLLLFWSDGKIIYSTKTKKDLATSFSTSLLTKVVNFKNADFAIEKLPDGTIGLMHAAVYNEIANNPPLFVVQWVNLDGIFSELQNVIGTAIIAIEQLESADTDDYHLYLKEKNVLFHLPLLNAAGKYIGAVVIKENITKQLDSFQHTKKVTYLIFSSVLLIALLFIFKILQWISNRTNYILQMLHLVSKGSPLPPSNLINKPDVLGIIENGIREHNKIIQTSKDKLIKAKETAEKEVLERKYAEETLLKISNQNKMLLECAGEGIFGLDKNGLSTFINPAACEMIGWTQDELLGKPQHDLIHHTKEDGSQYHHKDCYISAVLKDGESRHVDDEIFWRKDGTSFPVEYLSTPIIEDDKIVGAVVVFGDITDRKLSGRRTKRLFAFQEVLNTIHQISFKDIPLEKQLYSALEAILTIPWLFIQNKGAIFLTNDNNKKELKMTSQIGLNNALISSCTTVPFGSCICGRAAQAKIIVHADCIDSRHEITFDGIQPHGHYAVPILLGQKLLGVLTLYLNEGHKQNSEEINLLLSIGNSLSSMIERKKGEENLININQELEKRVNQRTLELQNYVKNLKLAQEQLIQSERMAALGGLVAGVAHEIKTPVGTSYTSSSYLKTQTANFKEKFTNGGLLVTDLKEYLEEVEISTNLISSNLDRAGKLVENFKEIAVDQTSQERRTFNLKDYINEIIFSLSPRFKNSKHIIHMECPDNIFLDSYPGALSQILTNLIINSLIYGFDGIESGKIEVSGSVSGKNVSIIYSDNGVGMRKKTVKQIYEPFFTTKRNFGGSGLGMNIVFNIVTQRLSGTISCDSALGKGTKFYILFPINA
ncbi:MAG: PAS domain S-box protein [Magnetococcales bacterium]|nr:PAS domain S-box protein [Magnetococcales bacterium]